MVKIDLRDLIVRRRFKIPARSYVLHDTILKQILRQEPVASNYLKDAYFTYTRNGFFRFDYQALSLMICLSLKQGSFAFDDIERCKGQPVDCVRSGFASRVISTPLEIAYAILGEDSYGCICEVVGYPLLYELVQKKLLADSDENEVQESILVCHEYLTKTFVKGLNGIDLMQKS